METSLNTAESYLGQPGLAQGLFILSRLTPCNTAQLTCTELPRGVGDADMIIKWVFCPL